jgi:cephalosporin hydroxylase
MEGDTFVSWDREKLEASKLKAAQDQSKDAATVAAGMEFLRRSYDHDYPYQWTWAGLPIIQMPEDILTIQEVIWSNRPSVVLETGVAWGGSIALYASLLSLYCESGKVLGIDLNLDPGLQTRLDDLALPVEIHLLKSDSTSAQSIEWARSKLSPDDRVMVLLDSHHTHDHVLNELRLLSHLVTSGQVLVVCDTIVRDIPGVSHRQRDWDSHNNPHTALEQFLGESTDFVRDENVNRKLLTTLNPGGYVRRVSSPTERPASK